MLEKLIKRVKSQQERFRKLRKWSLAVMAGSFMLAGFAIWEGYRAAERARTRVYVIWNGKAFEAAAADRKENLPVELRDHLRTFHRYFFDLDPDEKAIKASVTRSLYLADQSAKALYDSEVEKGFINGVVSGNISVRVELDSIVLDTGSEPYRFRCVGVETLTRTTSVTTRSIVTQGEVRDVERTDDNPHGFLIERFEVVENKDIKTVNR